MIGTAFKQENAYEEFSEAFMSSLENVLYTSVDGTKEEIFRTKSKIALQVGIDYDEKFFIDHGLKASDLNKPSFKERAFEWAKKRYGTELVKAIKAEEKEKQKKQDKNVGLLYAGVTTDRGFNLLRDKKNLRLNNEPNYRQKWIHDVFTQCMWEQILSITKPEEFEHKQELIPPQSLGEIMSMLEELKGVIPVIRFTDKKFREVTGARHLSSEEIRELVLGYSKLSITGTAQIYHDPTTGNYRELMFDDYRIAQVVIKKSGNYSRRNQKPEYEYFFDITVWGLVLFHNLYNKSFTKLPEDFATKLKPGAQEIYRKIAQFTGTTYNIQTIAKIIGYGDTTLSNIKDTQQLIEKSLNQLKQEKLIKGWSREGSGVKTKYKIKRI